MAFAACFDDLEMVFQNNLGVLQHPQAPRCLRRCTRTNPSKSTYETHIRQFGTRKSLRDGVRKGLQTKITTVCDYQAYW